LIANGAFSDFIHKMRYLYIDILIQRNVGLKAVLMG
jgi:hypothetical protein